MKDKLFSTQPSPTKREYEDEASLQRRPVHTRHEYEDEASLKNTASSTSKSLKTPESKTPREYNDELFLQRTLTTSAKKIAWSSLEMGKLIGSGGYGEVYQASWQGVDVAVKQLHLKTLSGDLAKDFEQEANLMAQCQFPHVVRLYGVCQEPVAMVMEYLPKGSLYQVLHDSKEALPWNPVRWEIAFEIGKGLSYLHQEKIIHRDLKSLNVLLDAQYHAKITDFGLAKIKLESTSTSTKAKKGMGTTRWRAPELFERGAKPNAASDVYSYGMVLWEIASRQLPFSDAADDPTVIRWIEKGEQEEIPSEDCPKPYGELVQACWSKDPHQRPSAEAIVQQLNAIKPQTELPKHHAALRHFYGEDESQCNQRLAGQAYTAKTLRYLLPMLKNRARAILSVYEEKGDVSLKEAVQSLCLLSKALGRLGVLILTEADPNKAVRALLVFGQQCVVVEVSPNVQLTRVQKAIVEELQDESVLERIIYTQPLLSTPLDAKESGVVLVGWLSEWLKRPLLTLLEGLNQMASLSTGTLCRLETLDAKSFRLIQQFSSTKLRRRHENLLSDAPEKAVTSRQATSEEAFVQHCYDALPQRLLHWFIKS